MDWLDSVPGFWGVGVGMDADGNVYTTGASPNLPENGYAHDIYTIKYAPDGTRLWLRSYNNNDDATNQEDDPSMLAMDSQGNVIVVGSTHTNDTGDEAVILKYDPSGTLLWERLFGGPGVATDYGFFVATDPGDNVYATGRSFGDNWDFLTVKLDPDGNLLWSRRRTFGGADEPRSLYVDASGRVLVTGQNWSQRVVTVAYDTDGNELWARILDEPDPGPLYSPSHAILDSQANAYVTGIKDSRMFLAKYSPGGTLLFERSYVLFSGNRMSVDPEDNVIVTGTDLGLDIHTTKVNGNGDVLWTRTLATAGEDQGIDLTVTADGGVIVAGTGSFIFWLLGEYDAGGNLLWSLEVDPGGLFINYPRRMAMDPSGNVAVTGSDEIVTARFVPSETSGVESQQPFAQALTLDVPQPNPRPGAGPASLRFTLDRPETVRLTLHDVSGRTVARRRPAGFPAGVHSIRWDPGALPAGVYYVRLTTESGLSRTRSWTVIR